MNRELENRLLKLKEHYKQTKSKAKQVTFTEVPSIKQIPKGSDTEDIFDTIYDKGTFYTFGDKQPQTDYLVELTTVDTKPMEIQWTTNVPKVTFTDLPTVSTE